MPNRIKKPLEYWRIQAVYISTTRGLIMESINLFRMQRQKYADQLALNAHKRSEAMLKLWERKETGQQVTTKAKAIGNAHLAQMRAMLNP